MDFIRKIVGAPILPPIEKTCTGEIYNDYMHFSDLQRVVNQTLIENQKDQRLQIFKARGDIELSFKDPSSVRTSTNELVGALSEDQQKTIKKFLDRTNFAGTPFQEIEFDINRERIIGSTDSIEFYCNIDPDNQTGQYGILNVCFCTPK